MENQQSPVLYPPLRIASIGLGKLGLCSAACFAGKGHHVIGVDSDHEHVEALRSGPMPRR